MLFACCTLLAISRKFCARVSLVGELYFICEVNGIPPLPEYETFLEDIVVVNIGPAKESGREGPPVSSHIVNTNANNPRKK